MHMLGFTILAFLLAMLENILSVAIYMANSSSSLANSMVVITTEIE